MVSRRALERLHLNDPDGALAALFTALAPGQPDLPALAGELGRLGHRFTLVDLDVVEPGNLARQFLYGSASIGRKKGPRRP